MAGGENAARFANFTNTKMKNHSNLIMAVTMAAILCFPFAAAAQDDASPADVFWNNLKGLCGKAFAGEVLNAPENDTTFKGRELKMHVRQCETDRIKIPFVVGDNLSRTWILTKKGDRIELRHDHRNDDGSPDTVTMYGGWTTSAGMANRQMFPADAETVKNLPRAGTNVWWIELVPGEHYTYSVRRVESDQRISVRFDLKNEIEPPPAPWGWADSGLDTFWNQLRTLCGKAFEGVVETDTSNSPDFAGKRLVMHVRSCEENRIRIPFFVGDDRSRTWVLTRKGDRIELKHDHRQKDGTPDKVTMYGGTSNNAGEAIRQFFPADEETTRVVDAPPGDAPTAAANIWWIELVPGSHYSYNLRRLGRGRLFTVKFDLTKEIEAPPAPWGWKD
jgi:hypothetical protein